MLIIAGCASSLMHLLGKSVLSATFLISFFYTTENSDEYFMIILDHARCL